MVPTVGIKTKINEMKEDRGSGQRAAGSRQQQRQQKIQQDIQQDIKRQVTTTKKLQQIPQTQK